ncbi:caprin-1-like isoform X2 [Oppia nitens]|uniref:caprin-1-like isoform X2 n=1 Tax=Oppia nitens TaxID=1686743 RepID=UPI0023D9F5D2|nr:caprin-1-like isoform X2 [Oppia nitens]
MPSVNTNTSNTSNSKTNTGHTSADIQEPHKLVQNLVDKKIRNLEKRKARLQELQTQAEKGQQLEEEQQKAIKKLDQVVEMIDLMKDLNKSICEVLTENSKQQKKIAKKELLEKQIERQQQELDRLKTILQFQDILAKFETTVRTDFSKGTNGAIKLSEEQLNNLDKLFSETTDFSEEKIDSTTEKLIALADGKNKEAWNGVTYHQLKELMNSIVDSKYFASREKLVTPTAPTNTAITEKSEETTKQFTKESEATNATKTISTNISQIPTQFTASGISFMTNNSGLDKDPAVVAVASVPNTYPYNPYGHQTSDQLSIVNSVSNSNQSKTLTFDNQSSIPTQTFTNQQYTAIIPNNVPVSTTGAVFSAVPVTLAQIHGLIQPDITPPITTELTFTNQQNLMNSNAIDKQTSSHERQSQQQHNFNDENFKNNRIRNNRFDGNVKRNGNGSGNRPRNPTKGTGYSNQNSFGNYSNKYDPQTNGNTWNSNNNNNTFGTDRNSQNNNFNANRNRPPMNRPNPRSDNRPRNANNSYSSNFSATAAAK